MCDSYVRPTTLVRICDECSFGNYQNKCVVCGGEGISDAFYCFECTPREGPRRVSQDYQPRQLADGCEFLSSPSPLSPLEVCCGVGADAMGGQLFYQKKTNRGTY